MELLFPVDEEEEQQQQHLFRHGSVDRGAPSLALLPFMFCKHSYNAGALERQSSSGKLNQKAGNITSRSGSARLFLWFSLCVVLCFFPRP